MPEGRKRVLECLMMTDEDESVSRTNLFAKVVIALLLDEDVPRILNAQRSALLNAMRQLTRAAHDHALLRFEADIRWIDLAEARLTMTKLAHPSTTGAGSALITARGLEKHHGQTHALRGVDVTIRQGEIVEVMGPSGSGKSTLCRRTRGWNVSGLQAWSVAVPRNSPAGRRNASPWPAAS